MLLLIAVAIAAEKTRLGGAISAPAILIIGGAVLSNTGVIPLSAPLYGGVVVFLIPVAIAALLLKADIGRIIRETGTMALPFLLGALFVVVGALLAGWMLDLGPEGHKVVGAMAATSIGGSMNFVAVSSALQFDDASLLAAAVATDSVVGASYLILMATVSGTLWFSKRANAETTNVDSRKAHTEAAVAAGDLLKNMANTLAVSLVIAAVGILLAAKAGVEQYAILVITVLAVLVANIFRRPLRTLRGDTEIGILVMYLFFFVVGASTDLNAFVENAGGIVLLTVIMLTVHVVLLVLATRWLKFDPAEALIASNACILGPATAAALAASRGWQHLITPGLMCGLAGYVIANFAGIGIARLLL